MKPYKCMIFFYDGRYIWTETYYVMAANNIAAMDLLNQLAIARYPLLYGGMTIGRLRVSCEPTTGFALTCGPPISSQAGTSSSPWIAAAVNLTAFSAGSPHGVSRSLALRGLKKGFETDGATIPLLNEWLATMIGLGFCIKATSRELPLIPILAYADFVEVDGDVAGNPLPGDTIPLPSQRIAVITAADTGYATGQQITIRDSAWNPPAAQSGIKVNGRHYIAAIGTRTLVVVGYLPTGDMLNPGTLQLAQTVYLPITQAIYEGPKKRDTGGRSKYKNAFYPAFNKAALATISAAQPQPPITSANTGGGTDVTFPDIAGAQVFVDNQPATIDQIKAGDYVAVYTDTAGKVVSIADEKPFT